MRSPRKELVRLVAFAAVAFSLGFLPYIDNLAQVFGFIFGLLSSVAFFPYITFGDWDAVSARITRLGLTPYMRLPVDLFVTRPARSCWWL